MSKVAYSPYDPITGKLRSGIFRAFVKEVELTLNDYGKQRLVYEGVAYKLKVSRTLRQLLLAAPSHKLRARVSFQYHSTELWAVPNTTDARIY